MSRRRLAQYAMACENCGREIVAMPGHWQCPYCGWNNPHTSWGGHVEYDGDDETGLAFTEHVSPSRMRHGLEGGVVVDGQETS